MKVEEFWDSRDVEERQAVLDAIKEKYGKEILRSAVKVDFEFLRDEEKEIIRKYFEEVIKPQMEEKRQQLRYDGLIEEELPASFKCPRCGGNVKQVFSKRGIHYKCQNPSCRWDSNRPFDFDKEARRRHIRACAEILKKMFPEFNFVENFPYSPDMIFTGRVDEGKTNYDISVYWMGNKIQRLRVEINQNLTKEQFFKSNYCYVIGIPSVVEYLAKRKGLVVHYLVDEPKHKILVSRMDMIVKHCPMQKDRFGNLQYFIPKEVRPLLVTDDYREIKRLLTMDLFELLYGELMIL